MISRTLAASLLAAATLGTAAAPAAADSISYVKDGDVWLTTPDGSRQFQVTTSGRYAYASQADDGTFIALTGETLHRLDRYGNVTAAFDTPVSDGPPPATPPDPTDTATNYFNGPFDPEISPDGTKVSYTYYWQHWAPDYVTGGMKNRMESGTAISHADRLTKWDEFGGNLTGWKDGSWIDSSTLLRSDAGVPLSEHAVVNRGIAPGAKSELVRWFREGIFGSWDFRDPELSRDGSKLAMVVDEPAPVHWHVRVMRTTGDIPAPPEGCFRIVPEVAHQDSKDAPRSPSWSPDGLGLAYADGQGVQVVTGIDLSGGCKTPAGAATRLLVPGARQPDWGPADVPAARPVAPQRGAGSGAGAGGAGGPGGGGGGGDAAGGDAGARSGTGPLAAKVARTRLRVALKRGLPVAVTAPGAGEVGVVARRGSRVVARGSSEVGAAGRRTVKVRFTPTGRRALRRSRRVALKLAVTYVPRRGAAVRQTVKTTLSR